MTKAKGKLIFTPGKIYKAEAKEKAKARKKAEA